MFHRGFITVAVLTNAVIGNLCMMPMAQSLASDVPMSPAHCKHCAKVQSSDGDQSQQQSQQQSGCAGHCFDKARSTTANAAHFNAPHVVAASPLPITIAFAPQTGSIVAPPATAPPTSFHIDTIVLRL